MNSVVDSINETRILRPLSSAGYSEIKDLFCQQEGLSDEFKILAAKVFEAYVETMLVVREQELVEEFEDEFMDRYLILEQAAEDATELLASSLVKVLDHLDANYDFEDEQELSEGTTAT